MDTLTVPRNVLSVSAKSGHYFVSVEQNNLKNTDLFKPLVNQKNVLVISQQSVADLYYPELEQSLIESGSQQVSLYLVPQGDEHKNIKQVEKLWDHCIASQYRRNMVMIALGGGMIGDLTGFASSCYLRGVDFVQCPTTLLSQIDASIGGKTAVNHPKGKNLLGTFYSPRAVIIDPCTLQSLPKREFLSGLAELIKYGMILDADLFRWLEDCAAELHRQPEALEKAIKQACKLKAKVVSEDEFEAGNRVILNFGHTIGHAIESLLNYRYILHGEAVAIGMVIATNLACELNGLSYTVLERLVSVLKKVGLPCNIPESITVEGVLKQIKQDKKYTDKLNWVLLSELGKAQVSTAVPIEVVEKILCHWSYQNV